MTEQKKSRPTPSELESAAGRSIPDVIAPGLRVLFCGINPSLYSAATGFHFARPGNRFWRALYEAGFTDRLLEPSEQLELLSFGLGITNIVTAATASEADIQREEMHLGGQQLTEKVRRYAPAWLAFLGIGAYRTAFNRPKAIPGLQHETIEQTRIWVLPNPSGLNAHYTPPMLASLFRELCEQSER